MNQSKAYAKKMVFFACLISVVGLMAIDFINPSLPYIMQSFAASQNATKGLTVTYMIAIGVAQFLYGSFSDNYGRKRTIILSFIIAIVGFLLSALSQNLWMLYLTRFITALGTAGCPVIARAIISDVCKDDLMLKRGFSYFAMSSQLSPALAPTLGGVIQEYSSWRISFVALAIINLIAILYLLKVLPESHVIPKIKNPLRQQLIQYGRFFRIRRFMIFNFLSALIMAFTLGYYSLSPFIFHQMGIGPSINGLLYIAYAAGLIFGALCLSQVVHNFNSEKTFACTTVALLLLFIIAGIIFFAHANIIAIIIFSFLLAFICGIAAPLTLTLCLQGLTENKGAASAVQGAMRYAFAGVVLLACNFIVLTNFFELIAIFFAVGVLILLVYTVELIAQHATSK